MHHATRSILLTCDTSAPESAGQLSPLYSGPPAHSVAILCGAQAHVGAADGLLASRAPGNRSPGSAAVTLGRLGSAFGDGLSFRPSCYAHSALHAKRSQLALTAYGMEHYLLSPGPRDSLIDANKEGVCTCAGPPVNRAHTKEDCGITHCCASIDRTAACLSAHARCGPNKRSRTVAGPSMRSVRCGLSQTGRVGRSAAGFHRRAVSPLSDRSVSVCAEQRVGRLQPTWPCTSRASSWGALRCGLQCAPPRRGALSRCAWPLSTCCCGSALSLRQSVPSLTL